jgi:hypothetical protein
MDAAAPEHNSTVEPSRSGNCDRRRWTFHSSSNDCGTLVYRLFFSGHESQEGTRLADTPKNREKLEPVRTSLADTYRKHLRNHTLPRFGRLHFANVTVARLRTSACTCSPPATPARVLSPKTARAIIDGTFRALYRDARAGARGRRPVRGPQVGAACHHCASRAGAAALLEPSSVARQSL